MNKLLIITGDLATGKSTFAKILSERYKTLLLIKDKIKEILGDTIGFTNRIENLKLSKATIELMFYLTKENSLLNQNIILEANFHEEEINQLILIAREYNYEILSLVLTADVNILHKRYLHRVKYENRHPVHLSTNFDDIEAFTTYLNINRSIKINTPKLEINANDFTYQTNQDIMFLIDTFMKGTTNGK